MKKIMIISTIAMVISVIAFIATSALDGRNFNRYRSDATIQRNSTYGPAYNPPAYLAISGMGSDYESPLVSRAGIRKEYTDDGYNGTRDINGTTEFHSQEGAEWELGKILDNGRYFENNLVIEDFEGLVPTAIDILTGVDYRIYKSKNYDKKFTTNAYAAVSCSVGYFSNYRTVYQFYAEVPSAFHDFPIRNPAPQTEFGSFSHSVSRGGSVNGWHHELTSEPSAWAEASGFNPSNEERHNTRSESVTPSNADVVSYY